MFKWVLQNYNWSWQLTETTRRLRQLESKMVRTLTRYRSSLSFLFMKYRRMWFSVQECDIFALENTTLVYGLRSVEVLQNAVLWSGCEVWEYSVYRERTDGTFHRVVHSSKFGHNKRGFWKTTSLSISSIRKRETHLSCSYATTYFLR